MAQFKVAHSICISSHERQRGNLPDTTLKLQETKSESDRTALKLNDTNKTTDDIKKKLETQQREFKEKSITDEENAIKEKIVMIKSESTDYPSMVICLEDWKL